jgi:hypothetical protein
LLRGKSITLSQSLVNDPKLCDLCLTNVAEVQNYQRGYPLLAAFQSSESSFSIYRSFDYLHSRVVLDLQDELRELEEGLSKLDKQDYAQPGRRKCVTSRSSDLKVAKREGLTCSGRSTLLDSIRKKLVNYDEIIIKMRELNAFQRPSKRDYRSLRRWFYNTKPLSYECEELFVKRKEDLITLRHGREWAGFDGWIEDCVRKLPKKWSRVRQLPPFKQNGTKQITSGSSLRLSSARRPMMRTSSTTRQHVSRDLLVSSLHS